MKKLGIEVLVLGSNQLNTMKNILIVIILLIQTEHAFFRLKRFKLIRILWKNKYRTHELQQP